MTPMRESLKIIPERTFFVCAKSPDEDGKKMHKNCNHQNCRRQEFEIYFVLFGTVVWNVLIFAVEIESCKILRCSKIPASLRGQIPTRKARKLVEMQPVIEISNRAIKINWSHRWADRRACLLFPTPKLGARMSRLFGRLALSPKCSWLSRRMIMTSTLYFWRSNFQPAYQRHPICFLFMICGFMTVVPRNGD